MPSLSNGFDKLAHWTARQAGRASTFALALTTVLVWGISGPMFGWSDTWQLVINTATTIITFLMRYCSRRCRERATAERRKAGPDDEPEPLEILLATPMPEVPVIEAEVATAPAPAVRVRMELVGHTGSRIANAPPIHDDAALRAARMHDRAGDERFIAVLTPALSPDARERARAVRVKGGDPAAQLLR